MKLLQRCLAVCGVLLVGALISSEAFAFWGWTPGDSVDDSTQSALSPGYHPDQPIAFSHQIHAGKLGMDCQYCHSSARRSAVAGVPPLNTCMGCHNVVRTEKESIKYLTYKYKHNEPVEWTKVHDVPDYVRFSHMPHNLAGITCQQCHGQVQEGGTAEQWAPLQMGWCIGCHREKGASIECATCHY